MMVLLSNPRVRDVISLEARNKEGKTVLDYLEPMMQSRYVRQFLEIEEVTNMTTEQFAAILTELGQHIKHAAPPPPQPSLVVAVASAEPPPLVVAVESAEPLRLAAFEDAQRRRCVLALPPDLDGAELHERRVMPRASHPFQRFTKRGGIVSLRCEVDASPIALKRAEAMIAFVNAEQVDLSTPVLRGELANNLQQNICEAWLQHILVTDDLNGILLYLQQGGDPNKLGGHDYRIKQRFLQFYTDYPLVIAAAQGGSVNVLDALMKNGANVNVKIAPHVDGGRVNGITVVHACVDGGNFRCLLSVLSNESIQCNEIDLRSRQTPLQFACCCHQTASGFDNSIVLLLNSLMGRGFDYFAASGTFKTTDGCCFQLKNVLGAQIIQTQLKAAKTPEEFLEWMRSTIRGSIREDALRRMLAGHVYVKDLLDMQLFNQGAATLEVLLDDHRVDVTVTDKNDNTILHLAAKDGGTHSCVKMMVLLSNTRVRDVISLEAVNKEGKTVLDYLEPMMHCTYVRRFLEIEEVTDMTTERFVEILAESGKRIKHAAPPPRKSLFGRVAKLWS
jgi:hypothetical protein